MTVSSFRFLSIHDYCRPVASAREALATANSIFCPPAEPAHDIRPPEFVDDDDRRLVQPFISRERNRDLFSLGFDGSRDLFFARLDNVIVERRTWQGTECFRIFVDRGVALSEPYVAHYKADWSNPRRLDSVFIEVEGKPVPIYMYRAEDPAVTFEDPAIYLLDASGASYYHWMCEVAPRLWILDEAPELMSVPIVVNTPELAPFQRETLGAIACTARFVAFPWQAARFRRLYLPCFLTTGEFAPRVRTWFRALRERLGPRKAGSAASRRLYISRADAARRRVTNDDEVAAALAPLGFERVTTGHLPVPGQLDLFSDAEAIVLPHGAAGTNLAAAPAGTLVVECHPAALLNATFWQVAHVMDQRYGFVVAASSGSASDDHLRTAPDYLVDMTIDPDKLRRVVSAGLTDRVSSY